MRVPYSEIRIAHVDGTAVIKDCPLGESGVILVKGPQVFEGYKSNVDNASAWIEDGWFNTGDIGYMDAEGFLYLSGRAKDLIIRSGHNIDPELIEEPLNAHADVVTSIAIGLPDPYAGELPMAYVVKVADSDVTEQELIDHCASAMSERAAIPKRIAFIDAMPLTAVGKIFRPTLRQKVSEQVIGELLAKESIDVAITSEIEKKRGLVLSIDVADKIKIDEVKKLVEGYIFTSEVN